jgi:carnitine-CoA ligase
VRERSLTRRLDELANDAPARVATRCAATGRELTYAELRQRGLEFATLLRRAGTEVGGRVGIMLPNSLEWVVALCGSMVGGYVDVGIDADAPPAMLGHYLRAAEVDTLVCDASQLAAVRAVDNLPQALRLVVWGAEAADGSDLIPVPAEMEADDHGIVHRDPREDMSIRFTSGTTGPAKAAVLTQSHVEVWASHFNSVMGVRPSDRLYTPFPLSHHLASVLGVVAMIHAGATCVIDRKFSLSRFWDQVRNCDATLIHVLQPTINLLMSRPPSATDRDHNVRRGYIGIPDTGFEERFGVDVVVAYGLTEGSMLAYMRDGDPGPQSQESVDIGGLVLGRPNPHFDVRILDEWDEEVSPGDRGIICFRPHTAHLAFQRYHNNPVETVNATANQWFHTGDLGVMDPEGYLHFFGRSGDTIRRKGHNIPVFHVEEAARKYEGVREAAIIPIAGEFGEPELKLIVAGETADSVEPRALIEYLSGQLSAIMVPSYVEVRTELPRTRTHKVFKKALMNEGEGGLTAATLRTSDWSPAVPSA